jgi:hypothetical protein
VGIPFVYGRKWYKNIFNFLEKMVAFNRKMVYYLSISGEITPFCGEKW